jgi:hypothetical protein
VKIALSGCALGDNARPEGARTVVAMVDFLFTLGQAASALFLLYGGFLVLMPPQKKKSERDEMQGMHLRTHA